MSVAIGDTGVNVALGRQASGFGRRSSAVLRRDVPLVFVADSELMIRRAEAIAKEFNVRMIVAGARQGYKMADELKSLGAPVLVSTKWPVPPPSKEDRDEQPLRVIRDRQLALTTPAVLAKSGVLFALVSGAGKTGDYFPGIRKAIDNGLSADDALRATTINPARIIGIDRQLGSLDRGKIANIVITDKPIFDKEAKVKRIFIDGRESKVPAEDDKKDEKKKPGATGSVAGSTDSGVEGSWSFVVKASAGDVSISAMLLVENGQISGTFSGDRGSGTLALRVGAPREANARRSRATNWQPTTRVAQSTNPGEDNAYNHLLFFPNFL